MPQIMLKTSVVLAAVLAVAAGCSNGGGSSDGAGRGSNSLPNLQLNDGDVLVTQALSGLAAPL